MGEINFGIICFFILIGYAIIISNSQKKETYFTIKSCRIRLILNYLILVILTIWSFLLYFDSNIVALLFMILPEVIWICNILRTHMEFSDIKKQIREDNKQS